MKTLADIFGVKIEKDMVKKRPMRVEDIDCSSRLEKYFKAQRNKDYLEMDIREYKERKDKLKIDLLELFNEFNKDIGSVIVNIDIDFNNVYSIGDTPKLANIDCKITTEIDQ